MERESRSYLHDNGDRATLLPALAAFLLGCFKFFAGPQHIKLMTYSILFFAFLFKKKYTFILFLGHAVWHAGS